MQTSQREHRQIILGLGTGRCGTHALAVLLDGQPDAHVTHEQPPLLPWKEPAGESLICTGMGAVAGAPARTLIRARLGRFRRERAERVIGDVASFYLPYVEAAIEAEPGIRIICLKRPREEVVASFCRWLDTVHPLPMNHWAERPAPGWHHDPVWTRIFPQYDVGDREKGVCRYWNEYYQAVEDLVRRFPERIRVFSMDEALNTERGQRAVLSFAGIPEARQVLALGRRTNQSGWQPDPTPYGVRLAEGVRPHPRREIVAGRDPRDPRRCVVLVPYTTHIVPDCEKSLKELEQRGYPVRRVRGYAAIDQGRNQMATDALVQGFEETMWIDADIGFDPDAVERLRSHGEPIVCGIYAQKGRRALACHLLPGTSKLIFGEGGGLQEILYAGTGFLLAHREVYSQIQRQSELPVCNERFGRPTIPFFQPLIQPSDDGWWSLAEDYSFCARARQCGYRILADTMIRLWHVGQYAYGWEDAGIDRERFGTFTYHLE